MRLNMASSILLGALISKRPAVLRELERKDSIQCMIQAEKRMSPACLRVGGEDAIMHAPTIKICMIDQRRRGIPG